MLVAALVLACVALICAAVAAAVTVLPRRLAVRCRVIVQCKDDSAFSGVLWRRAGSSLVLRGVKVHRDSRDTAGTPVDGEILLDRAAVSFIQVLPVAG